MIDGSYLLGAATLIAGVGVGGGIIVFTERQGTKSAGQTRTACVECKGKQVCDCAVCESTGEDPFASLVACVREMAGTDETEGRDGTITVEDWGAGATQVSMYKDILSRYEVKATTNVCQNCAGRGVVVCSNCDGSGIQPLYTDRIDPGAFQPRYNPKPNEFE